MGCFVAIYSCSIKTISRGSGQTSVASAAYRAGEILEDQRLGKTFDYHNKAGIESTQILAPQGQKHPEWIFDRQTLWNEVELAEKRKNSTVAREVLVALPHELSQEQRHELTSEFSQWLANNYQVVVDMAIHQPSTEGDDRNHHAHIMMTPRIIEDEGFASVKSYTENGKTVRKLAFDYGGKRGGEEIKAIREKWAEETNSFLQRSGSTQIIDHRSLKDQGLDREPTFHLGHEVMAMERKNIQTTVGQRLQDILHINEAIEKAKHIAQYIKKLPDEIYHQWQKYKGYTEEHELTQEKEIIKVEQERGR